MPEFGVGIMGKPLQKPHPPIAFALRAPKSGGALLCAERGWIPISGNFIPASFVKAHWEDYAEECGNVGVPADREGLKGLIAMYFGAFPDLKVTHEFVLADGDKVIIRWNATGTHTGPLGDIPATGNKIATHGISIAQIADGKIVGAWNESDQMDLMQQLGVIPAPGE